MTPDHFKIHPYFWTTRALLQALYRCGDAFVIESCTPMRGAGQTDYVLRPIGKAPSIAVAVIARNEERDLPRMLKSIAPIMDWAGVVDTGSTDRTKAVAVENGAATETFTGASELDGDTWRLWDFSKARNLALERAEKIGFDWIAWFDADDELVTPDAIRRASYYDAADAFGIWIDGGGPRWVQHRMWKREKRVRFKGRCHEYAVLDGLHCETLNDALIKHHAEPVAGSEDSNPRNLRILLREWQEEETPRTAFYIANTYRDANRNLEAVEWYRRRIGMGDGFRDEWLFAKLSAARCLRALERHDEADELSRAAAADSGWAEFTMDLAFGAYARKLYGMAIEYAKAIDLTAPILPTPLWRENGMYRDQPPRLISWCYEHTDDLANAIAWAEVAAALIGGEDAEWEQRRARMRLTFQSRKGGAAPAVVMQRPAIAINRPGAIGDVLMSLNLIPQLKAAHPGHEIHYFCHAKLAQALGGIMAQAGVDLVMDSAHFAAWEKRYAKAVNLVGYLQPGYPEKPLQRHVMAEFAREMGLPERKFFTPCLQLDAPPRSRWNPEPYCTLQMRAAWSPYKNWPTRRWEEVVEALPDIPFVLIGAEGDPLLYQPNVDRRVIGTSLQAAINTIANARLHVGVDSFAQHVAHYYWRRGNETRRVPAVILYGSTQATATGYDDYHNIGNRLACSPCFREDPKISRMPRDPCPNMVPNVDLSKLERGASLTIDASAMMHRCMAEITVDEVVAAIRFAWYGDEKEAA